MFEIRTGDCLDVLRGMADSSIDSIVTDPPYGLSFMGKKWDYDVPDVAVWAECLRVLKPGGHLLAFAGTRTQHRMAVRIEDAGFEIRDMIAWVYGSGFPKSLDVSKAIDKAAGAEREVVGVSSVTGARKSRTMDDGNKGTRRTFQNEEAVVNNITAPATPAAQQWAGWGTALKPALEPITVARKPLVGTVAENVLQHGTGGINVDGCRVAADDGANRARPPRTPNAILGGGKGTNLTASEHNDSGRWPANLIHDGSEEVVGLFPDGARPKPGRRAKRGGRPIHGSPTIGTPDAFGTWPADAGGSAARFFYCAKASKADRDEGNTHPTVKPTALLRYLCRLVTPPGGLVLDPFAGSGSTGKGALLEGFRFLGIERDPEYARIAQARCAAVEPKLPL